MDWFENDVIRSIASTAEAFAGKELTDFASAVREGKPAEGLWEKSLRSSGRLGLWLGPLPAEFGGTGMDAVSCAMVVSKLAGGCAGFAAMLAVHYSALACLEPLLPEKPVEDVLKALAGAGAGGMPSIISLAHAEEIAGLDSTVPGAANSSPHGTFLAMIDPEQAYRVVLTGAGQAVFIMDPAKLLALCRSAFPGSGLSELAVCRLDFGTGSAGVKADALVTGRKAFEAAEAAQARLKLLLSAAMFGNAEKAQMEAVAYARERRQTGRLIIDHQEVRKVLVNSEMLLKAVESFLFRAAAYSGPARVNGIMPNDLLFRFTSSACEKVCLDAVQTLGGYGYMKDYGVEKRLRDTKTLSALPGSFLSDVLGQ